MPPKKKVVINKETNDILEKHFGGEISLIKISKLTKLFDEGIISNQMMKFLKAVKQVHNKSEKGDVKLNIVYNLKKLVIDDDLNDILKEHFNSKIESIKTSILSKLRNNKTVTKTQYNTLLSLKKASNEGTLDEVVEYDLKEESDKEEEAEEEEEDKVVEKGLKNLLSQTAEHMIEVKHINKERFNEFEEEYFMSLKPTEKELQLFKYIQDACDLQGEPLTYEQKIPSNIMTGDEWNEIIQSKQDKDNEVEEEPELEPAPGPDEEEQEPVIKPDEIKESKYIVPHRKAFVNYINQGFYKQILKEAADSDLNVYQVLVKEYLSIETPYRGLLVYHGLGTGKSASAVSMAEKVSSDMRITTLLPASLENNFIGEVKKWGKDELDLKGSHWTFIPFSDIEDTAKIRNELLNKYEVTADIIREIMNHAIREVKKKISLQLIKDDFDIQHRKNDLRKQVNEAYKKLSKNVLATKGFWKNGPESSKSLTYDELEPYQQTFLECQLHRLVQLKYNFIHYNPLPTIRKQDEIVVETDDSDEDDLFDDDIVNKRSNEAIKQGLLKRMKDNIKKHDVESPFYEETIIIDEVHNFVREVLNDSGSARLFYEWIVNAEKVKLVFLSGTPIINKPCEIAILYNMLKGRIKLYRFTIKSNEDPVNLTSQLNDIFYKKHSSIELFHISRKEGKLVITFTQNQENFISVMNPDNEVIYTSANNKHDYKDFIKDIYVGLNKVFDDDDIIPSKADALSTDLDEYVTFDKMLKVPFHSKQHLFEIMHNDELVDLTQNEQFMDYFFQESYDIEDKKKTLLRRMLMGLTSYYPIDRSQIGSMPTVTTPQVTKQYENYVITKNITVEPCTMSSTQFSKYIEVWRSEKKKDLVRQMRRHLHDDMPFDFNIRTRQNCNMIYKDDEFRYIKDGDRSYKDKLEQYEKLKQHKSLEMKNQLSEYSPKLFKIMTNIQKFMDGFTPTGKVLVYSEFRGDSGIEAFEQVLKANGYSLYDPSLPPSNSLKYTFITGEEGPDQRKLNMDAFNATPNKLGEQIQVMIISGAGAEGISLTCVRQVHIVEPYWNFVRIDQVFGRAIRLHSHDDLEPKDRTVEEYLYLSVLPSGETIEEIYNSIKDWENIPTLKDVKKELGEAKHKEVKETIDMVQNIGQTIDQKIFDIMERKFKVSQNIIDIIKESSLDCIQHTRDDPQLNERCIRFSNQLLHEIAYFPGISASELFEIDRKQLKAAFQVFVKPNHYVISGGENEYIYYEVDSKKEDIDVRYIRENAKKVCSVSLDEMNIYFLVEKDHDLNESLGKQFSVYQDIFSLETYHDSILDKKFPSVETILKEERIGYKIKYNVNEMMFYSPNEEDKLRRLYRFEEYVDKQLTKPLIICPGETDSDVYVQD